MPLFKPAEVRPLGSYRLYLRFGDGVEGEVDLTHLAGRGVFALWDEPGAFERVRVDEAGALVWGDEVDLDPDALYLRLTGKSLEQAVADAAQPA